MPDIANFTAELSNKDSLRNIARDLGYVQTRGKQAGKGSIKLLLEAIAKGEVLLIRKGDR